MKIIVSDKTRQTINREYTKFMADPNNLARLKLKLTYNQRVFIESLQEAYNDEDNEAKNEDRLLLLQEAILTFNARPELVPNAPIDLLKKSITFKDSPDDFEQLIVLIKVWRNSLRRSKRPVNRAGMFFAKWYKVALYPFFVAILTAAMTSILTTGTTYLMYNHVDTNHLVLAIVASFISLAAGKGIYFRLLAERTIR